jgi:hypothetical protein
VNKVVVVKAGPDKGVYVNGVKLPGVLKIEPDLFGEDSIAVARVTLAIDTFSLANEAPQSK